MGRKRRPHLPGAVFHLTARTQGKEPWFTPVLRTRIVDYAASEFLRSDATLLAYAIMPNHLHLVLRQGQWTLGRIMQPLLRRVALLVQRSHGVDGHVFERRFGGKACLDPEYVRAALVYTHLNPVRAHLVDDPRAYRWSSHSTYLGEPRPDERWSDSLGVEHALRLFAPREGASIEETRAAYVRYMDWRIERDRQQVGALTDEVDDEEAAAAPSSPPPPVLAGDICWARTFAPLFRDAAGPALCETFAAPSAAVDLGEIARQTLEEQAPELELDEVRSPSKRPEPVRVRRMMIRRLSAAGHSGATIARYLRVSDQCVSNVLRSRSPS